MRLDGCPTPIPEAELVRLEKLLAEDWTTKADWSSQFSGIVTAVVTPPENVSEAARYVLATIEYVPEETPAQFDARGKLMSEARNVLPQLIAEIRAWRNSQVCANTHESEAA